MRPAARAFVAAMRTLHPGLLVTLANPDDPGAILDPAAATAPSTTGALMDHHRLNLGREDPTARLHGQPRPLGEELAPLEHPTASDPAQRPPRLIDRPGPDGEPRPEPVHPEQRDELPVTVRGQLGLGRLQTGDGNSSLILSSPQLNRDSGAASL